MGGDLVDGAGELEEAGGSARGEGFARAARDGGAGGVGFPATQIATSAARAVQGQRDVPELGGVAIGAAHQASVDHRAAADTGGDGEVDEVALPLAGAEDVLAEGGGIAVVVDPSREVAEGLAEFAFDRVTGPTREIRGAIDAAAGRVERSGRGDAEGQQIRRLKLELDEELLGGGRHALDGLSRAGLGMGLDATRTEHGTILGDHAEGELGAAEIES